VCVLSVFLMYFFIIYLTTDFDTVFLGHRLWLIGEDYLVIIFSSFSKLCVEFIAGDLVGGRSVCGVGW
jgi:hypothetical protein